MVVAHSRGVLLPTTTIVTCKLHAVILLLVSSAIVSKGNLEFCRGICRQTENEAFCLEALGNAANSMSSVEEIQQRLLGKGQDKVDELVGHYNSFLLELRNEESATTEYLTGIVMCIEKYSDSSKAYSSAQRNYDSRNYAKVRAKLNKVLKNTEDCPAKSAFPDETTYEKNLAIVNINVISLAGHPPKKKKSWW